MDRRTRDGRRYQDIVLAVAAEFGPANPVALRELAALRFTLEREQGAIVSGDRRSLEDLVRLTNTIERKERALRLAHAGSVSTRGRASPSIWPPKSNVRKRPDDPRARHCHADDARGAERPAFARTVLEGNSWQAWRVLLIAMMGEPLTNDERAIFARLTGRLSEPLSGLRSFSAIIGRRVGSPVQRPR